MQDKRLLVGIVVLIAAVILILIVLWAFPPRPPGPENTLTDTQVRAELGRLERIGAYPENLKIEPSDYPKAMGLYKGRVLEEIYFCSDVCPDYGRVYLVFQGVDPEECKNIGGRSLHDLAWGGYIGCEPRVV